MALRRFAIPKNGGPRSFAEWKAFFFDKEEVSRMIGKKKVAVLARYANYMKRVAQTSMRYRKAASPPGQPPSAHKDKQLVGLKKLGRTRRTGAKLREYLFSAFDPSTRSAVVGSVGFQKGGGQPTPSLQEHGGNKAAGKRQTMAVKNPAGRDPTTGRFYSRGVQLVPLAGKTLHYPKRPTMNPALKKTVAKFPNYFRGLLN